MKHKLNSINTKQMLVDALIALSSQKPFSKITVSEIVDYCNINRKTFYYHFTDIYDLLEYYLNSEISLAISTFDPIKDINATTTYAFDYMNQHAYLKNFLQDTLARDKVTQLLNKAIYPKTLELIQVLEHTHRKNLEDDFKLFLANSFTRIIVLSLLDSIENPNNYDVEKIQEYISTLFQMSMQGVYQ